MTKSLTGKVALVTGGSRGIGAASARALADEGADVAISYVASADKAEAVVSDLKAKGVAAPKPSRPTRPTAAEVDQLVKDVAKQFGRLDILVNNAGVAVSGAVDDPSGDTSALDRQYAINVDGVVTAIRAASKLMGDGGRIVTIGSGIATRASFPGLADYAATKAAIVGYTKGASRDLGPRGITVNVLQPGSIDTDMNPKDGGASPKPAHPARAAALRHRGRDRRRRRVPRQPRRIVRHRHGAQRRRRLRRVTQYNAERIAPGTRKFNKGISHDRTQTFRKLGGADHGWLKAKHHFSFGSHYDPEQYGPWLACASGTTTRSRRTPAFPRIRIANMEIITYVREGAITHQDSLGNKGRTEAGDVQVMSAGTGVRHAEYNLEPTTTRIFQIWIEPTTRRRPADLGREAVPEVGPLRKIRHHRQRFCGRQRRAADPRRCAGARHHAEGRRERRVCAGQDAQRLSGAGRRQRRGQRRARQRPRRRRDPRRGEAEDHRAGGFRAGAGGRGVSAILDGGKPGA